MSKRILTTIVALLIIATIVPFERAQASTKDDIVSIARGQLGTPYKFGGTTPSGFDCSGFLGYVFGKVGISLPRTSAEQYNAGEAVSKSNLEVGDLVFFETYKKGPSHSGIYIGDSKFIHASSTNGISISSINDPYYWKSRYLGAKRVLEEEPEVKQVSLSPLPVGQYHDVKDGYWAEDSIRALSEQEIINGYPNSIFKPSNSVTRAQVATILTRVFNLEATGEAKNFNDVNSNFHAYDAIQAVASAGFFAGDSNGNFNPNDPFTREHIALVFSKAFELSETTNVVNFADIKESRFSYDAIQKLAASGITSTSNNEFRPGETTTRAQLAVFLDRALTN